MSEIVSIDQLGEAIERELTLYENNVIDGVKKEAKKQVSRLVKDTKATAPVGNRGKYRDSITSKRLSENKRSVVYVWYVKGSAYRLSHLLEKGHANRDGSRTAGTHFIQKASDPILKEFVETVERIVKNG